MYKMQRVIRSAICGLNSVRLSSGAVPLPPASSGLSAGADQYIIRSPAGTVQVPEVFTLDLLWSQLDRWPEHIAIECAETRKSYTYRQLMQNTQRFATSLARTLRLRKGDVVAVVLPNMPEFAVAALGTMQAGFRVTALNPIYTEFEFSHQFAITRPKIVVTVKECYETIIKALKSQKQEPKVIIVDRENEIIPPGSIRFSELGETGEVDNAFLNQVKTSMDDVVFLPFSSGTTGLPKAVEITQKNLNSALKNTLHEKFCLPDPSSANFQEVVPCVLPFFHIYGMVVLLLAHLLNGCKLITLSKFKADIFLEVLKRDRATLLYVVPPLAIYLGKSQDVKPEHLASVKYALSGGAPLVSADLQALIGKAKHLEVLQGYGSTETTASCSCMPIGWNKDFNGVGIPMSNTDLRLVCTSTGNVLPPDQVGELQIRGPQVSPGYFQNDAANKESFTEDGFYRSGDLASYSETDGLRIQDRLKELIKVKGLQVAPAELESVLCLHPEVLEAGVIGTPHETMGEVPRAFVVLRNPAKPPKVEELKDFVAGKVAPFKKIHQLQYIKELPKSNTGKILRIKLSEM